MNQNLSDLRAKKGTTPPGTIKAFSGSSLPSGWLYCDGSVVSQATYPKLFTAISTTYNTGGEGGGNFRLPDLRGKFDRALDNMGSPQGAAGIDSGRSLGSNQSQTFAAHAHNAPANAGNNAGIGNADPTHNHNSPVNVLMGAGNQRGEPNSSGPNQIVTTDLSGGSHNYPVNVSTTTSVSIGNTGSGETRPTNISAQYYIKY